MSVDVLVGARLHLADPKLGSDLGTRGVEALEAQVVGVLARVEELDDRPSGVSFAFESSRSYSSPRT